MKTSRPAAFILVPLACLSLCAFFLFFVDSMPAGNRGPVYHKVAPASSLGRIADELVAKGLVRSGNWFRLVARFRGIDTKMQAGTYEILPGTGTAAIAELIASGKQACVKVTIPEGFTARMEGAAFEKAGFFSAEDFLAAARDSALLAKYRIPASSAEGYLLPDTYLVPVGSTATEVASLMLDNFFTKAEREIPAFLRLPPATMHETLILASIVEREYRRQDEAARIAGVFSNRIKIGMGLQSCATIVYIITDIQGKPHPSRISKADTKIESQYNTYKYRGLPPGPISNPGFTSIKAALAPEETDALYFRLVDESTGTHRFSRTIDEHNEAVWLSVKGR